MTNLSATGSEQITTPLAGYDELLRDIKARVSAAQVRAALAVNRELILLYWGIGRDILLRQEQQGWGAKVIDRLSADLRREFSDMRGFSTRNLKYMRAFAEIWPDEPIVQQVAAQIPWFHNCILLDKIKEPQERLWYARAAIEHGWSRNVLVHQIESRLYERQGKSTTNFERTLPAPQSDLARQLLKDPYNFEFLTLQQDAEERELEKGLVAHIQKFLLELGSGFAFVGRQYHLDVGGEDYYIDLLFYHLKLRCYIVIELKSGRFKPEYAGKMNFYLAVVDDLLRHPNDAPTIGVSEYQITEALPDSLKGSLPTVEQLENELAKVEVDGPVRKP